MAKGKLVEDVETYILDNREMHYRLAYSYVRNKDDALDIIQEAIYKAIVSLDSIDKIDYINTWFCKIIINTSLDYLRKSKRLILGNEEILETMDLGSFDNYEDIDLTEAIKGLPEIYRSVIILRYFEDFKIKEIAQILDENINTVNSRLYKALEILKIQLD